MLKAYTYEKEELISLLKSVKSEIDFVNEYVTMMEEQGLGLRDNLDWASVSKIFKIRLNSVKNSLSKLEVIDFETEKIYEFTYDYHLIEVKDQFVSRKSLD